MAEKAYFVHPSSYVDEGCDIGAGTKIWHFSHIMSGCTIGERCNIGQNVVISPGVRLGDGCKIQNNVSVWTKLSNWSVFRMSLCWRVPWPLLCFYQRHQSPGFYRAQERIPSDGGEKRRQHRRQCNHRLRT